MTTHDVSGEAKFNPRALFRGLIPGRTYTLTLPDGSTQTWVEPVVEVADQSWLKGVEPTLEELMGEDWAESD